MQFWFNKNVDLASSSRKGPIAQILFTQLAMVLSMTVYADMGFIADLLVHKQ